MFKFWTRLKAALRNAEEVPKLRRQVVELEKLIADRTTAGIDLESRGRCFAVVVGYYRGVEYVETFQFHSRDMNDLVHHLKAIRVSPHNMRIDTYPELRASLRREL